MEDLILYQKKEAILDQFSFLLSSQCKTYNDLEVFEKFFYTKSHEEQFDLIRQSFE